MTKVRHILGISGGKDSAALAIYTLLLMVILPVPSETKTRATARFLRPIALITSILFQIN